MCYMLLVINFALYYRTIYYQSLESECLKPKSTLKDSRDRDNGRRLVLIYFLALVSNYGITSSLNSVLPMIFFC